MIYTRYSTYGSVGIWGQNLAGGLEDLKQAGEAEINGFVNGSEYVSEGDQDMEMAMKMIMVKSTEMVKENLPTTNCMWVSGKPGSPVRQETTRQPFIQLV